MGLSIGHLLVILAIVLVIFGTKKLRAFGGDLGGAIKNFKQAVREEETGRDATHHTASAEPKRLVHQAPPRARGRSRTAKMKGAA